MTTRRFGKSSSQLLRHKSSFFEENEAHVKRQRELAAIYIAQPRRSQCKNCAIELGNHVDFIKDEIGYVICIQCTHLNGIYEDTDEFCAAVYTDDEGSKYAENYSASDIESFQARVTDIYVPKAEFLIHTLREDGNDPLKQTYLDFGAGSGYLVSALSLLGIKDIVGTDVSQSQAILGNNMMGRDLLRTHAMDETQDVLRGIQAEVICMIGTLEHLQNPRETMELLSRNENVQYVFISVPMFSLAVFLELLSPDVFHRQLHGGHTHLYTAKSLRYLYAEFGFESKAEWWFGTDIVDLYRHIAVTLSASGHSEGLRELWQNEFGPLVDELQVVLDKSFFSSQVHVVLKKIHST